MTTTITATPDPTHSPPRITLSITTTQTTLTVYRIGPDGSQFQVRTTDDGPLQVISGAATLSDPEVPFGQAVYYTSDDAATTASATVTLDVADVWLIHPNVPSRSMQVDVVAVSDRVAPSNRSVRYPLGRRFPIAASDGQRKAPTYTLVLATEDADTLAGLESILDDLSPLLLNVPPARGWIDPRTEYIDVGDLTEQNPAQVGWVQDREFPLPCTVVDRPTGGSQAFNTYGTSAALYATYADRKAAAATYGAAYNTSN